MAADITAKAYVDILKHSPMESREDSISFLLTTLVDFSWHYGITDDDELKQSLIELEKSLIKTNNILKKYNYNDFDIDERDMNK